MHAIQGAMAVRRERRKRGDRRRRSSVRIAADADHRGGMPAAVKATAGDLSAGPPPPPDIAADSAAALKGSQIEEGGRAAAAADSSSSSSVTAFHLGVVFILIAFLLLFSGLISRSRSDEAFDSDWSTLIGVGIALLLVGLFMVMINRILTEREEEELAQYVHHRLARTRSGHALALRETQSGDEDVLAAHLQQHRRRRRHLSSSSADFRNGPVIGRRGSTRSVSAGDAAPVVLNGKVLPAVTITREAASPAREAALAPGGIRRHGGSRASLREYNYTGRRSSRAAVESERLLPREEAKRRLSNPNVLLSSTAIGSSPRRSSKRRKNSAAPIIVCSPPSPSISPSPSGANS